MYPRFMLDTFPLWGKDLLLEKSQALQAGALPRYGSFSVPHLDGTIGNNLGMGTGKVLITLGVMADSTDELMRRVNEIIAAAYKCKTVFLQASQWAPRAGVDVVEIDSASHELLNPLYARLNLVFTVQPFWREVGDPVITATRLSTGVVTLGEYSRCTGKLVDAVIRFKGPFTSARVEGFNNTGITVSGVFTASDYVFVDLAGMRAWKSTSHDSWTGKGTQVDWDYPAGGMLTLEPDFETGRRRYALKLTTSGTTVQSAFSVRSSKWHL